MINDRVNQLEERIKGKTKAEESLGLMELLENAIYLGAERVKDILKELITKIGKAEEKMRDYEYRLLLRELKILQDALSSMVPNEIPSIKNENKKITPQKQVDKELGAAR